MSTSTAYFVIYSNTSRNSTAGLRPQVMWMSSDEIIKAAAAELRRSGEALEDMAGVPLVEDADGNVQPARALTYDEQVRLSIEKLGDDGRLFLAFRANSPESIAAFREAAQHYGITIEAHSADL
jgi:hypothetical protein